MLVFKKAFVWYQKWGWSVFFSVTICCYYFKIGDLRSLDLIDQLFAVLIKLRVWILNTFSKHFSTRVCLLWHELKCLNPFLSRYIVKRTVPFLFVLKDTLQFDCTGIYLRHVVLLTRGWLHQIKSTIQP